MISRSLGIYGWSEMLDNLLVTGIVTGDPILLLSQPGHGKTAFCKRLGKVITDKIGMETTVRIINVSTARPEDWTGYYLPPKDGGDEMSLVKSPQSLLDAVFIMLDEIGRSETARNQNNLLSLIQDRMIDGIKTKCEILFAAMNPVAGDSADEGSMPLLYSVADRFSMLLEVPDFKIMENNDKMEVVSKSYRPNSNKNIFAPSLDGVELGQDEYLSLIHI